MSLPPDWKKRFVCQMCGNCCDMDGYVKITQNEAERIAEYLNISIEEFHDRYLRREPSIGWSLRDHSGSTRCIMLTEEGACRIHKVKPEQCKNFPTKWSQPEAISYCEGLKLLAKKHRPKVKSTENK